MTTKIALIVFSMFTTTLTAQTWSGVTPGNIYYNSGSVGIGASNPQASVDILKNNATLFVRDPRDNAEANATIRLQAGGQVQRFVFFWNDRFTIDIGEGSSEQFTIKRNGNVGIGTSEPDAKLAVNGVIHTKEVNVDMDGWPDFVFENKYDLPALEEVENFISENKHLPDIPSEAEVMENGINLGEMNAKLLKKVEELTLYLIEQNKQNHAQQTRIIKLEEELKALKQE